MLRIIFILLLLSGQALAETKPKAVDFLADLTDEQAKQLCEFPENVQVFIGTHLKLCANYYHQLDGMNPTADLADVKKSIDKPGVVGQISRMKIEQILSPTEFIGKIDNDAYYVSGVDVSSNSDGDLIGFRKYFFEKCESKTYTTVIGASRTVRQVKAIEAKPIESFLEQVVQSRGYRAIKVGGKTEIVRVHSRTGGKIQFHTSGGRLITGSLVDYGGEEKSWILKK